MGWTTTAPRVAAICLALITSAGTVCAQVLEPQAITFQAADGMRIAADYFPPLSEKDEAPIAILLHDRRSDRGSWRPLIGPLRAAGFAILAPDLRGHGQSATTTTRDAAVAGDGALFRDMQNDVRGAYDWLARQRRVDRARFVLIGAGVGASVAFQYASQDRSVDVIVALSPCLHEMGLDAPGDLAQVVGREVLLIATEPERDAPYTLKQRCPHAHVSIVAGQKEGGTTLLATHEPCVREIERFVRRGVGEPSADVVVGSIESHIYHTRDSGWVAQIAPTNLRYYSSPQEAEARGLRAARSKGPPDTKAGQPPRGRPSGGS